MINDLLGLAGFALVVSGTPGPNNALLLASGIRFGLARSMPHVAGTAVGMATLIFAMATGVGVALLAVPGADLAVKLVGSAYLLYLAVRIAASHGVSGTAAARPFGVLRAAAFQFANPKAWLFALGAASAFLPQGLAPLTGGLTLTATSLVVIFATQTVWAGGGAVLSRFVSADGRTQRAISVALALVLAASVAFIWL
jgi:threonine/homoserine/homoserine lactone efflux protein